MSVQQKNQNNIWLHLLIIIVGVIIVYSKVFSAGFMSWDDIDYVFNTPDIRDLSAASFKNYWTEYYIGNYQPLPVLAYAIDFSIGGEDPFVYHLTCIVWHIATAIMLYLFIKRLQGNDYVALFVALLFALHPAQTESVSWIAAINKPMNAFFFLAAAYCYAEYAETQNKRSLLWVYLLGIVAYFCKLTAVTLPFALIAVDIWKGRALNHKSNWLEKLPLIILAIPIGLINLQAQDQVDFLSLHPEFTAWHTIVFASYGYMQYLINLILPYKLSVLYPYPKEIGAVHILYTILSIAIVVWGVVAYKRKQFVLAGGILFFTVNIAIVLQFVQFGEVLMADRYLYLACIGIWYPIAYYAYKYISKRQFGVHKMSIVVLSVICMLYSIATFSRNDIWLSEMNFWQSVIDKFPNSSVAQNSVGGVYLNNGDLNTAQVYIEKAVEIDPTNYKALYNKGVLLLRKGDKKGAIDALSKVLRINEYTKAYFTRALAYQESGNIELARLDAQKVIATDPENAKAHYIIADCQERRGAVHLAIESYTQAILIEKQESLFFLRRALAYAKTGNPSGALKDLDDAIILKPNYTEAWYWRGMVKYRNKQNPCNDLQTAYQYAVQQKQQQLANTARSAITEICKQQ